MSRLEELMGELCPDGVTYLPMGQICVSLKKQILKKEDLLNTGEYPVINSGRELYGYYKDYNNDGNTICIASRGNAGFVTYMSTRFWAGGLCYPYRSKNEKKVITKFIFYYLKLKEKYIMDVLVSRGSIPALNKNDIDNFLIPVPSLPIQEEIVRILDTFTELTRELTRELTTRKKQCQYYNEFLLDFGLPDKVLREKSNRVQWGFLRNLAEIGTGNSNTNEELDDGTYPFYVRSQEVRRKNNWEYDETAIITAGDGVGVGKVFHFAEGKYALHQRAYRIHITDKTLLPKFFFYYMKSNFLTYITKNAVHASVTSIRRHMLDNFPVPIPPLDEQARIVAILDRFDALCNDLTSGLPAEIEARKKQYEYYRDKLLTFKEAVQ